RGIKYGNSAPVIPAPTPEQQQALEKLNQRMDGVQTALRRDEKGIERAQRHWEQALSSKSEQFCAPARDSLASFQFEGKEKRAAMGGSIPFVAGHPGRAASFDGTSYFDTSVETKLDIDDPFTLTAWIYSRTAPDGSIVSEMIDDPRGKGFG